jgi:hypothetical protein
VPPDDSQEVLFALATLRGERMRMLTLRTLRNAPLDRVAHRFRPFSLLNFVRW